MKLLLGGFTSSAISICIPNIELYVTEKLKQSKKEKNNEEFEMTLNFKMNYSHSPEEFSLKPHQGSFSNLTDTLQQFSKSSIGEVTLTGLASMELASIKVKSKDSFGPKSILTNIAVFLPASLFKILSLSILIVAFGFDYYVNAVSVAVTEKKSTFVNSYGNVPWNVQFLVCLHPDVIVDPF